MASGTMTIGGYLWLDTYTKPTPLTGHTMLLSSGRACIAAALKATAPDEVLVPHYICDSVLEPMSEHGVRVKYYAIGRDLLPKGLPEPNGATLLLVVNYFGLLGPALRPLARQWGDRCIMDHSQAFFGEPVAGSWTFNSARKFFGVSDGAQLFAPCPVGAPTERNHDVVQDHLILALMGSQEEGLAYHRANEHRMSTAFYLANLTSQRALEHTDRARVRERRTKNFQRLHALLGHLNRLEIDPLVADGPYHYPLLPDDKIDLAQLHAVGIFAPRLWPDVLERVDTPTWEYALAKRAIHFPVDQRYTEVHMDDMAARFEKIRSTTSMK